MAAVAAHRSQYPIEPAILPLSIPQELMGQEYFVRIYPVSDTNLYSKVQS
jgi:hypothetical protein